MRTPRPAPDLYPRFLSTTRCPGIDYVITRPMVEPEGYGTRILRAGSVGFLTVPLCPSSRLRADPDGTTAATRRSYVLTFGIVQRLTKFNAPVCDAVAAVLERVPGANLVDAPAATRAWTACRQLVWRLLQAALRDAPGYDEVVYR